MFQLSYCPMNNEKLIIRTIYDSRAVVQNLAPGTEYIFHLRTVKGLDSSVAVEKKVITKPAGICGLTLKMVNSSSATVMWNPTKTNFTSYKASLSNNTFIKTLRIPGTLTDFTVMDLTAGGIYNFTLQRVKGNTEGASSFIEFVTEPAKPEGLRFFNVSSYFFSLYWRLPYGLVDRFHVDLIPDHASVVILDLGVRKYQADFSNTIPGTTYNVTVSAVSSSLYSSPASRTVTTNVTNPGPPVYLAGERVGSAGILLSWNTPLHPNGRILSYIVKYKEVCPWRQTAYTQVTTKPDSLEVLLTNLNPGTTYEIMVAAENSAGIGVFSDLFLFQTAESAPGKVVNLTVEALNSSAVNLIWFLPRQPNGKITSFKISVKHARSGIVVKDVLVKVEDLLSGRLPECNDKSESFLWSTTTPSTTFGKSTIPSQTTVTPNTEAPSQMSSVWNEPISFVITNLRPYTTYLFEVSAVTTEAGYIDSAIVRTPESVPEDPPQNFAKSNVTAKSFSVMWEPPAIVTGKFSYRVELYGPSGHILDNSTKDHKFVFSNLVPFTTYDVYVGAETSAGVGPKTNLTVFTPPDVPGAVSDLHLAEVEATYIKIVWRKPRQPNGIITQYRVKVHVQKTLMTLENIILGDKNTYLIDSLEPYTINENINPSSPTWNSLETANDLYEGSAEMFSSIQTASPVIFTSVSGDNLPAINGAAELHSALDNQYTINILAEELSYVIKSLTPFTDYTISVSAFTAVGEGPPSVLTVRTCEQVPSSVQNISYKNISSSSVLLYWDPPANPNGKIIHYTVYAMELDTKRAFHTTTSNNSLLMTGLKKYTNYRMRVAASTAIGESALSEKNDVFVRTPEDEPDSPPRNIELINVSATEINLKWLPPEQPNGLITHYEVLYSDSNDFSIKNASSTSISLSEMKPYTLYNISVRAFTRLGHGNQSSFPLLVRTSETVPDSAPENITYRNISSMEIELSFFPPSIPNGIIQAYTIYLNRTNGIEQKVINTTFLTLRITDLNKYTEYTVEVSASTRMGEGLRSSPLHILTDEDDNQYTINILAEELSYVIKSLTPFTDYTISVSAFTAVGEGPPSVLTVRTCEQVPSSVQNISYKNISSSSVLLYWDPPANPNGKIIHYTVYAMELDTKRAFHTTTSNNSLLMTGLKKYTNYRMRVAASTAIGESALSEKNDVFVRTPEDEPDSPPRNIELINVSATEINLKWLPPEQPNGLITHYEVLYSDSNDFSIKNASSTSISLSEMKPYTLYNISVRAFTRLGHGNQSSFPLLVRTSETVPDSAPENITYRNISSMEIELSFFPPSIPNGIIQAYTIYLNRTNGIEQKVINTTFLTLRITDLNKYTEYTVEVSASTRMGEGLRSSPLHILTDEDAPSSPPQSLSVKQLLGVTVKLSWKPPLEPNGIILYYTVYVWNKMSKRSVNVTETSLEFTDLEYNYEYSAYLTASTRFGDGNIKSDTITFRTSEGAPSDPPKDVAYRNLTSTSIMLFWSPPQKPNGNILYYSVYFKNNSGIFIQNFTAYGNDSNISMPPFVVLDDLAKYSHYILWLTASTAFGDGNKTSEKIDVYTDQDIPEGFVENLVYQNISSSSVNVSWLPPSQPNGLVFFHVSLSLMQLGTSKVLSFLTYNTSIMFDNLEKYTDYILKITPATDKGSSEQHALSLHIRTDEDVPESAPIIKTFSNLSTTSVMFSWDPPVKPNGIIISYDLNLFGPERNNSFSTINNFIILEDLLPFTLYSIYAAARTIKGPGPSAVLQFYTDESVPLAPPQNLTIINYTADSVWLKWDPSPQSNGVIMRYNFKIYQNNTEKLIYQNISGSNHEANLVGLEPFSPYSISVSAFTKLGNGNQFSNAVQFTTMESVPDAVQNVRCIAMSWQSILVQWDPPASSNGVITHYIITVEGNSTNFSSYDTLHTFRNLLSNITYQIKIKAATSAGDGEEQICNTSTLPEKVPSAPRDIVFSNVQSTSVTLNWRTPKSILGYFQNYKITTQLQSIHCSDWETKECVEYEMHQYLYENVMDDWIEDTVYGLKKYRWYRFAVAASTSVGYGSSSPWISTQTLPGSPDGPPENVTVLATSPHSINISWSEPAIITGPTCYLIDVTSVDNGNYKAQFLKTKDEVKVLEISDLKAFTRYSVVIIAFTGDVNAALLEGKASSPVIVSTFEAVPEDPPNNITFQKIPDEVTKFQVTFVPPSEPNGNIQVYQAMVYNEDDPDAIQIHNLSVIEKKDQSVTAMIEGLKGGHTYNVSVYAINGAGAGPKIQLKITMDIKEPPRPKKKPAPVYDTNGALLVTATTIAIKMPICYYSDDHGPIKKIQILVVEAGAQHDGNVTKWYDAYFNRPRPYFTNEGFPNPPCVEGKEVLSGKEEIYVIGADTTCMIPGSQDKICNGPLKPRKQYLFKFRATNIKGQFTDSDYSDPIKTLGEGLTGRSVEVILAVTLCVLSVVLLVAAVYAFARIRQKQKEGGTYSPRDAEIIDTKFKLDQLITVADLELKDERFTRPISKKSFLQHVEELCTNNNLKFQEEFSLRIKHEHFDFISMIDNNNRVKLMPDAGIPGSDYINASYVSGYLCPNEFIATQGPLPGTVGDFWRMVWETRAKTLVMLTQCFEKGRIRCHQYWPEDNKPVTVFGDIVITKLMEDIQIDWTIRDLKIERHGDCMTVRQCNFTSWPEHGVPETTAPIIHFVKLIRASRAHDNTPMVVHCSAGVGRTGVYIALDHLTQHVNDHDFVDIYGLVAELRSERMCMVQNLAQYIFLHQCVLDLLTSKGSSQPICFVNYSALQKMDSLDAMEGDVELEWEETTM
ncbi:PREDICTED: phosphatidylinositol phosphatase PTPRQ [Lepidothrix coronata]|uniref:Phosphatidylinositol phosphatase PTPRQ n=1 Tax=Lepidothrix coronata TaxID=321398 RepID=A0A6J0GFC6_9PASS|nr:PREDICTED: phosphatidylinositol phosphatase PTPRQ [Lepidothrix coronata]